MRRSRLTSLLVISLSALLSPTATPEEGAMSGDCLRVENRALAVALDRATGSVLRIASKRDGAELVCARELAESFRLIVRASDGSHTTLCGRDQKLVETSGNARQLQLTWGKPLYDTEGRPHDLVVRMAVRLAAESVEFRLSLENESGHTVREVWYPLVGDLSSFGGQAAATETVVMVPTSSPWIQRTQPPFGEHVFGYPGQMNMSFASLYNPRTNRGVYFASHDKVARYKAYRFFEERRGDTAVTLACVQHFPHVPDGKGFRGPPVVVRFHPGEWHAAGAIYREWFIKTFGLMDPSRCWVRRETFFQDAMFLMPEGTLNFTFRDIPRWAQDAVDHGVTSLLISGWHRGGHDNGYPHYEPDPRLGTYEDLREGIAACHRLGAKVYFFVNYQPAMVESDWYKRELHQYIEMREDGGHSSVGWGMGTLWARMGHPKQMTWVDPGFPAYRRELVRQFRKLAEIGADGLHVDKMFPGAVNYNPRCRLSPDTSTWEGAIRLTETVHEECRRINPDFAMSFECNWDRMLQFGTAVWWVGNMSVVRSVFPEMAETLAILAPYDYLGVNNAVRSGHAVLLGPLNCARSIGWEPWEGLADYVKEVKGIQDRLLETVFLGEVLGQQGVELLQGPQAGIEYNVFRNVRNGEHTCVLTNSDLVESRQGIRSLGSEGSGQVRIHTPFQQPVEADLPVEVAVPGEGIVFVQELREAR